MIKKTKGDGLWIRLSEEEKQEIEKEANATGFNMSEIARQRLFGDPVKIINERVALLERRSLTTVAYLNYISERIEEIFSDEHKIRGKKKKEQIDSIKQKVIKAENMDTEREKEIVNSFI